MSRQSRAIRAALDELEKMSPVELLAEIEKHKDGPFAKLLHYAWHSECPNPHECSGECRQDRLQPTAPKEKP